MNKRNALKLKEIQMKDTSWAMIFICRTNHQDLNLAYQLVIKNGTSRRSIYFHDYTLAVEKFDTELAELKQYELTKEEK